MAAVYIRANVFPTVGENAPLTTKKLQIKKGREFFCSSEYNK